MLKREDISNVLDSIASSIDKEHYEDSQKFIQKVIKVVNERTLTNPENFYYLVKYSTDIKIHSLLQFVNHTYFNDCAMSNNNVQKFIFLFTNYDFLESHIEELCETKLKTSVCSCDVARYLLINVYFEYIKTGKIKDTQIEIEKYYKPSFGLNEQWIEYIDSLIDLFYGKTKKYFVAYNTLLTSDVVKYKHTIHYHKVTFLKNNQTIVVPCTYDAHKTPNVISIDEHGDYIIFKEYIPEDLLSIYKKVENAKYPDIYSVPHTDITIKTTSKEVME